MLATHSERDWNVCQDFDLNGRVFWHIYWMYPRLFIPGVCVCRSDCFHLFFDWNVLHWLGMGFACYSAVYHQCLMSKRDQDGLRFFLQLESASQADIIGSTPYLWFPLYLTLLTFVDLCMRVEYKSLYLSKGSAYAISSGNFNADYCILNRRLLRLSNAWSKFDSSSSSKFDGSYSSKKLNKKSVVLLFTNPNQILTVVVHQKSN